MSPSSYLVLANAQAGSTERDVVATAVARLAEDAPVRLRWTGDPDEFRDAVTHAGQGTRVVVAGGDGSIHLALQTVDALGRADDPIGIVPLGTGNDFARNHDLPLDPANAAEIIIDGSPTRVAAIGLRCGDSSSQLVANNMHVGLGVDAARTAKRLKSALGRMAYPVGTAMEGVRSTGEELTIVVDGEHVWDGPLLAVLVLLGPSMGGGNELAPTTDGCVDVVVIGPAAPRERISLVRSAIRSQLPDDEHVQRWTGAAVTISRRGGVDANVDGELVHLENPVELTYHPDAWCVLTGAR